MSTQVGTSSLPERLRWDEYAAMNASALLWVTTRQTTIPA